MLVLTAITFLTLDLRGFGPLTSLQEGARDVLSPVRSRADSIFRPLTDRFQQFNGGDKLRRDNEALRTELDQLKGQQLRDEADAANYRKLREQVGLQDDLAIPAVIGRVTYDLPGNFAPNTVEIDRGSASGLEKNQPVITKSGLVGRIDVVYHDRATVLQITLFAGMRIDGVAPELPLLLSILISLHIGAERSTVIGFVIGLSYDLALGTPLGLWALVCCLAAYPFGVASANLDRTSGTG